MIGTLLLGILVAHASFAAPAQTGAAQPPVPSVTETTPEKPWPPTGVSRLGPELTPPQLVKEVKPGYTAAAMKAKIEGSVVLEAVVQTNGAVGEVRVKRSLDREFGLDDEAVNALKKWRFSPGKKDGAAVPVLVEVEMTFTLKK